MGEISSIFVWAPWPLKRVRKINHKKLLVNQLNNWHWKFELSFWGGRGGQKISIFLSSPSPKTYIGKFIRPKYYFWILGPEIEGLPQFLICKLATLLASNVASCWNATCNVSSRLCLGLLVQFPLLLVSLSCTYYNERLFIKLPYYLKQKQVCRITLLSESLPKECMKFVYL